MIAIANMFVKCWCPLSSSCIVRSFVSNFWAGCRDLQAHQTHFNLNVHFHSVTLPYHPPSLSPPTPPSPSHTTYNTSVFSKNDYAVLNLWRNTRNPLISLHPRTISPQFPRDPFGHHQIQDLTPELHQQTRSSSPTPGHSPCTPYSQSFSAC